MALQNRDDPGQLTAFELTQALVSLACIVAALLAVAMSAKQWSASERIAKNADYNDLMALRGDPWLGISLEAHPIVISLAIGLFVPVMLLAAFRRTVFHYVACAVCGLMLIAACTAWFLVSRT